MNNKLKMLRNTVGSGASIVLVPGGLTGWLSWEPHQKLLSDTNQVTSVQLLAVQWGLENKPVPSDYSVQTEINALKNSIDELEIDEADFVAWSYGAEVTLSFALANPERIRSLTLIEPPAFWVLGESSLPKNLRAERSAIAKLVGSITEEQLVWFTHFAGFVSNEVDPRKLPQWPVWLQHKQSLATGDVAFRQKDDIKKVQSFSKPLLLFKGTGSSAFLHDIVDKLGSNFPNSEVHELAGGHAPQLVEKDKFLQILTSFLKKARQ